MTDQELLLAIGQVIETKLEPVREDIREVKERMGHLEEQVGHLEERMGRLEERVGHLEKRVGHLEERMGRLEERVGHLEKRVGHLEEQVDDQGEKLTGVRVYIDTDLHRTLNLLLEGQQALWDRFATREDVGSLEIRTSALEMAVKQHSQEIWELKGA